MNKTLFIIGLATILLGILLVGISLILSIKEQTKTKMAFGGFVGFIPFGFANDKRMLYFVFGLSLAILLLWIIFNFIK